MQVYKCDQCNEEIACKDRPIFELVLYRQSMIVKKLHFCNACLGIVLDFLKISKEQAAEGGK
jgi:hypothetical protein